MPLTDKARFALLWIWVKLRAFARGLWSLQTLHLLVRVTMISMATPLIASGRLTGSDVETAVGIVCGAVGLAWQAAVEEAKARKVPDHAIAENERLRGLLVQAGINPKDGTTLADGIGTVPGPDA